jgi:protein transport protein SEC13
LKIWYFEESLGQWQEEQGSPLTSGHSDWIRDVAWAPNIGLPKSTIATAGQDGRLMVWNEKSRGQWENMLVKEFEGAVWRVSWSVSGNLLSASDASGNVTLWKEVVDGKWQQIVQ